MDPVINQPTQPTQTTQNVVNQAPSIPLPQSSVMPEQVGNPVPKSNKKYVLYVGILGIIVIAIILILAFYKMNATQEKAPVSIAPSPVISSIPTEEAAIESESELDNIIVGLTEAEEPSLDEDLVALEKDSSF